MIDWTRISKFPYLLFAILLQGFFACAALVPMQSEPVIQGEGLFAVDENFTQDSSALDSLRAASLPWLGVPYLWGGEGPDSIDCSAFTQTVYAQALHILLPRHAAWQALVGVPVSRQALLPGDLVFFGMGEQVEHVGIYWGGGWFINATVSRGVAFSHLAEPFWVRRFLAARRLVFARGIE